MKNAFSPPTEAQVKYAEAIADVLGIDLPDEETKAAYSEFISEWAEDYQDIMMTNAAFREFLMQYLY